MHVISLVGMGGIGKTTLAKLVYNEDRVKSHFQHRIWVCVSDPFDEIRIAKAILESFMDDIPNVMELQTLLEKIQQNIERKKFLLVLDDIWSEDFRKWEQLKYCLESGAPGSKVLITTRKENVAKITSSASVLHLGLLSEEECWEIFNKVAFSERSYSECMSLEKIGRKLVRRCKGLPLAVKTIASLLRFKKSKQEWQNVLDSELWKLEEVEKHVLVPLWLSFIDLSSPLKQCFSYCAIFPKDCRMGKVELIGSWIALGYIRETENNKNLETIGDEYFHNLVMRSLLQDVDKVDLLSRKMDSEIYFGVHDIVHDFVQSLERNECCSIEVSSDEEARSIDFNHPMDTRHVGITIAEKVPLPKSLCKLRKLRSLVVLSNCHYHSNSAVTKGLSQIFNELICLRSLSITACGIGQIPSHISKLLHLRQLNLSCNGELKELPETICRLYNLHTLNVDGCHGLKSLPGGIGKLVNLRCLYNSGCNWSLPKGIGMLSGLRRLSCVIIGEEREAYLEIRYYKGSNKVRCSPSWISSLNLLTKLCLSDWRNCEQLPHSLGKLPSLESLEIISFKSLKKVGFEFYGMVDNDQAAAATTIIFPKLIELKFHEMEEWEEWKGLDEGGEEEEGIDKKKKESKRNTNENEIITMPSLRSLTLHACPKLKALPHYIRRNTSINLDVSQCSALGRFRRIQ